MQWRFFIIFKTDERTSNLHKNKHSSTGKASSLSRFKIYVKFGRRGVLTPQCVSSKLFKPLMKTKAKNEKTISRKLT